MQYDNSCLVCLSMHELKFREASRKKFKRAPREELVNQVYDVENDNGEWVPTNELTQEARDARVAQTWALLVNGEEDSLYDFGIPQRNAPGYADLLVRQSHATHSFFSRFALLYSREGH